MVAVLATGKDCAIVSTLYWLSSHSLFMWVRYTFFYERLWIRDEIVARSDGYNLSFPQMLQYLTL